MKPPAVDRFLFGFIIAAVVGAAAMIAKAIEQMQRY